MTQVDVYRASTTEDAYGDPQPGAWALWETFQGFVGWSNPEEPLQVGRNTVITNRTVYIRGTEPTGILATDQVEVEGVRYAIDGTVGEWVHKDTYIGAQVAIKAVS